MDKYVALEGHFTKKKKIYKNRRESQEMDFHVAESKKQKKGLNSKKMLQS